MSFRHEFCTMHVPVRITILEISACARVGSRSCPPGCLWPELCCQPCRGNGAWGRPSRQRSNDGCLFKSINSIWKLIRVQFTTGPHPRRVIWPRGPEPVPPSPVEQCICSSGRGDRSARSAGCETGSAGQGVVETHWSIGIFFLLKALRMMIIDTHVSVITVNTTILKKKIKFIVTYFLPAFLLLSTDRSIG